MSYRDYMRQCAREFMAALLVKHDGNVSAASRDAGMNRQWFYKRLHALGMMQARSREGGNSEWRALQ